MDAFYHRFDVLTTYVRSPLQHLSFAPGLNCWLIPPSENLREQVKGSRNVLVQIEFNGDNETVSKINLKNMIERKFFDKFRIVQFNKKLFVTVVGLSQK
jgi:hypothetical protein